MFLNEVSLNILTEIIKPLDFETLGQIIPGLSQPWIVTTVYARLQFLQSRLPTRHILKQRHLPQEQDTSFRDSSSGEKNPG
jgi:hypothetical protein